MLNNEIISHHPSVMGEFYDVIDNQYFKYATIICYYLYGATWVGLAWGGMTVLTVWASPTYGDF